MSKLSLIFIFQEHFNFIKAVKFKGIKFFILPYYSVNIYRMCTAITYLFHDPKGTNHSQVTELHPKTIFKVSKYYFSHADVSTTQQGKTHNI